MNLFHLLVMGLAVWRLASLFVHEEGPWNIFMRIRYWVGERPGRYVPTAGVKWSRQNNCINHFCRGFICVGCSSVWYATIAVITYYFYPEITIWLCLPLSISALAMLVDAKIPL
jgi:hypothetical protein